MKRDKKAVFQHQLKTLENIEEKINALIIEHRKRRGSDLGVVFINPAMIVWMVNEAQGCAFAERSLARAL